MTAKYAEGTTVAPDRSQAEILAVLRKYGAQGFGFGEEGNRAHVAFRFNDRNVQFTLTLPASWEDREFRVDGRGCLRPDSARKSAYEKEIARLWRCLALAIKAKLEVVSSGIATFDEEFLSHLVLSDGSLVGTRVLAELNRHPDATPSSLLQLEAGSS